VSHSLYRPYWYLLGGLIVANRSILARKLRQSVLTPSKHSKIQSSLEEPQLAPAYAGKPTS
jgi:hypothetical protein